VTVIIPVFNEEDNIPLLHQQLVAAMAGSRRRFEVVYVDDGSTDRSYQQLVDAVTGDARCSVIRLRRNFGQTAALRAGMEASSGDVLVFMDCDLQNDPVDIGRLLDKIEEGYDVVSGWRADRHDPFLTRTLPSRLANSLISAVTGVRLRDYGCTLKAYRRQVIEGVKLYGEMHRFIPAYAVWAGASIAELPVQHHPRRFGRSKYGLSRTPRVILDLLTVKFLGSYATKPIYFFGFTGLVLWLAAMVAATVVLIEKFSPPYPEAHNNPLLLLAVFLAIVGIQFILMGLLAEILIRIYHESGDQQTFVVREVYEGSPPAGDRR
jgi:glycosyltransferase involved in cell wall biosynthesis